MIRESQFQKAELKRMEKMWKEKIASLQAEADTFITKIETMKIERKKRSATLQRKLFEQFQILTPVEKQKIYVVFLHKLYKNFLQPEPVNVLLPNYSSMPISIN